MTEYADAVTRLLAAQPGDGTTIADRALRVCERLSKHLSRLIGENGVTTLLRRSTVLASTEFPWLSPASTEHTAEPTAYAALHEALQGQEPGVATEAFTAVLSRFLQLLKRLIGEGLVERLLSEVWPEIFPLA